MRVLALAVLLAAATGCTSNLAIQKDSRIQIWLAELSQVKVRSAQSRVFDTTDKQEMLAAVVFTLQDLGFQVAVLDEVLGVVSGKKFVADAEPAIHDPFYVLYDDESLVAFSKTYRTWGPFRHRSDLVRLTVTVRKRNEEQLIVRASAQHKLRAIEDPEPYQRFFGTLKQSLFVQRQMMPDDAAGAVPAAP